MREEQHVQVSSSLLDSLAQLRLLPVFGRMTQQRWATNDPYWSEPRWAQDCSFCSPATRSLERRQLRSNSARSRIFTTELCARTFRPTRSATSIDCSRPARSNMARPSILCPWLTNL